jgi:hypothetical protein
MKRIFTDLFEHATPLAMMPISSAKTSTVGQPPTISISAMESRSKFRKSIRARRRVSRTGAAPGRPKEKPIDNEPRPQTETASRELPHPKPEVLRLTLDADQTRIVGPLLDKHRDATKVTGLLAVLARSFRPAAGRVTLELQILEVDRRRANAVRKLFRG